MDFWAIMEIRKKVDEVANRPGLTEIQRAFLEQLSEELAKIAALQEISAEVRTRINREVESIHQYIESLRPFLTSENVYDPGRPKSERWKPSR